MPATGPGTSGGVHLLDDNREGTPTLVRLRALCGPDDEGEPVLTVMLHDEDWAAPGLQQTRAPGR